MSRATTRDLLSAEEAELHPTCWNGAGDVVAAVAECHQSTASFSRTDLPILSFGILWQHVLTVIRGIFVALAVVWLGDSLAPVLVDESAAFHAGH